MPKTRAVKKSTTPKSKESNVGVRNYCIACGHNHAPLDWHKYPGECFVWQADNDACSCRAKNFIGRTFKGSFA